MDADAHRVLVVDDDPAIRRLLQVYLSSVGCHVTEASDGLDALHQLEDATFDVILLDLVMPRLDGVGLLRELGAARPGMLPRVIVLSSSGGELPEDLRARVFRTIQKPVSQHALVVAVTACARQML